MRERQLVRVEVVQLRVTRGQQIMSIDVPKYVGYAPPPPHVYRPGVNRFTPTWPELSHPSLLPKEGSTVEPILEATLA